MDVSCGVEFQDCTNATPPRLRSKHAAVQPTITSQPRSHLCLIGHRKNRLLEHAKYKSACRSTPRHPRSVGKRNQNPRLRKPLHLSLVHATGAIGEAEQDLVL
nr:hypothetical protein CFP56_03760 [Quercus suber]